MDTKVKTLRSNSQVVQAYNDGLGVFVYDEALVEEIRASGAVILTGFAGPADLDKPLQALGKRGALFFYELAEDASLRVEIVVGSALKQTELGDLPWMEPARAFLHLPSGRLRVEGYGGLLEGPDLAGKTGATADVPSGHYAATLHRLDARYDAPGYQGPDQVIVLSPVKRKQARSDEQALLLVPQDADSWRGDYRIDSEVFHGLAKFYAGDDRFFGVNMDEVAIEAMGLKSRMALRVICPDLSINTLALYLDNDDYILSDREELVVTDLPKRPPRYAIGTAGNPQPDSVTYGSVTFEYAVGRNRRLRGHEIGRWFPATAQIEHSPPWRLEFRRNPQQPHSGDA